MIKALLLILAPASTWERIARSRRSIPFVVFLFLAPTIALSIFAEIAGHNYLVPKFDDPNIKLIPHNVALLWGGVEFGAGLLVAFLAAQLIQLFARTFHNRNTLTQCFAVAAYGLGPFYLCHMFDAIPVLSPWVTFGAGLLFSFATLYHAIPQVLKPDPPHAFGLFLMSGFVLTMINVIARMAIMLAVPARTHLH